MVLGSFIGNRADSTLLDFQELAGYLITSVRADVPPDPRDPAGAGGALVWCSQNPVAIEIVDARGLQGAATKNSPAIARSRNDAGRDAAAIE